MRKLWRVVTVCALAGAGISGGCASAPQPVSLTPGAEMIEVRQEPYSDVERARQADAAKLADSRYISAKGLVMTDDVFTIIRNSAVQKGASRVVYGIRETSPGTPMAPDVNVNVGDPYYNPAPVYNQNGYYDPSANVRAMEAGHRAGVEAARTRAQIEAAQPTRECIVLFYR